MIGFSLPGLGVAIGTFLTVAAGGLGAAFALFAALASSLSPPDTRGRRVRRYLVGPLTCVGVGAIYAVCASLGGAAVVFFDDIAFVCPVVGVVAGVVVQAFVARAHERRLNAYWTEGKEIEPG